MDEERKLYPFHFCTLLDEYPWGSEEFKLADLGYRDSLVREGWLAANSLSEVMDTYLDRVVGEKVYDWYGRQFPVCIRHLRVRGRMPLRVHPDDETASQRYDFLGKEKLWYVLRAGKDAKLMVGFRQDTDAGSFYAECRNGGVENLLNEIAPHAGQSLLIPSGTPHAASGDVEILEIAESSPMDFCLHGWGDPVHPDEFDPALSLVEALDFINYRRFMAEPPGGELLANLPQLQVERLGLAAPVSVSRDSGEAFQLYSCVHGSASLRILLPGGQEIPFALQAGETLLVPSECGEFRLLPDAEGTVLLRTTVNRQETDPYINPDAEPVLPEEE